MMKIAITKSLFAAILCAVVSSYKMFNIPAAQSLRSYLELSEQTFLQRKLSLSSLVGSTGEGSQFQHHLHNAQASSLIEAEGSGSPCKIKVIGVGGGGGNAVNRMISNAAGISGVELWTVNTDAQALSRSLAPSKLNIGKTTSR